MRGEATVKITRKVTKKRYHGKRVYRYERLYLPIPKRFHGIIEPFLNNTLNIEVESKNGDLQIILHPRENVSVPRKPPTKIPVKALP